MILLSGGTGYIGSHTCVSLQRAGFEVALFDNLSNSSEAILKRIKNITGKMPVFYEADMLDINAMDRIFEQNEIQAVIHFAGLKAVGESVEQPLRYYSNNISGTLTLLHAMERHNVKRIVFSSSATVYGPDNPVPYIENMPVGRCTSPYGQTKADIEHILQDVAAADEEWSVSLLRYFNPAGAHKSGEIGENPSGIPNNLVPFVAQVAAGKMAEVKVFGDDYNTPDGTGVRDYIHVMDLADGHVAALKRMLGTKGVEVYNLGTGKGSSVLEIIRAFEKACGKPIPHRVVPRRSGDVEIMFADTKKAEQFLNWKARYGIEEMCADMWNYQQRRDDIQ